jgi:hypothetical protein
MYNVQDFNKPRYVPQTFSVPLQGLLGLFLTNFFALILAVKSGNFDENAAEKMPRDV